MEPLALTFDDGPDARWTPALLDKLEQLDISATFFVIAQRAASHPELVARAVAQGHTVGLHCDEHVRHSDRDLDWLEADTERALDRLDALGVTPKLWRTPWGDTAPWTTTVARRHGLRIVGWDVDTHDWRGDSAETMLATSRERLQAGAVVLAHDGIGPGARRTDADETIAFTELVAAHAHAQSIELGALV